MGLNQQERDRATLLKIFLQLHQKKALQTYISNQVKSTY